MDDGLLGSTNKFHNNRPAHNYMKKRQREVAPSTSYNSDHQTGGIPTNNHSRVIPKQPHKVRIIHIVPPEIIQTDKANFKELVQSLTGRSKSAANTIIKKHHRPQLVSSNDLNNTSYLLGFNGSNTNSSHTELSPNKKLLYDIFGHQKNLNDVWNYDSKVGVMNPIVEKEEMMLQAPADTEWGVMKEKFDDEFCIDMFLELDEWLSKDLKLPHLIPNADSN